MKASIKYLGISIIMLMISNELDAQTLTLKFTNIRSSEGVFRIGIYKDNESFLDGDPEFYRSASKDEMKEGVLIVKYDDISPGTYGIVVLDDENSNDKTDKGIILPEEGFGFSNYVLKGWFAPGFKDFSFEFVKDMVVVIPLTYLN